MGIGLRFVYVMEADVSKDRELHNDKDASAPKR
jgi:hypothetical protein